jgi:hypothetical protein
MLGIVCYCARFSTNGTATVLRRVRTRKVPGHGGPSLSLIYNIIVVFSIDKRALAVHYIMDTQQGDLS